MRIDPAWLHWPETQTLIAAFAASEIRFVGGCVRDALLARGVKDVDAVTPLLPEAVMALLKTAGIKAIPTGIDHGTITAVIAGRQFEITTLRRDVSTDGRHATVVFTDDWQQDAQRRDFTMNALYCDKAGNLTDFFGGVEDAQAGIVKFIGDAEERIREDALRILRFFRFFAHYGKGPVDARGLRACRALKQRIDGLSGERIQQEMLKLLVAERAAEVVGLMQQSGIGQHVLYCAVNTEPLALLPSVLRSAQHAPDGMLALAALLRSAKTDKAQLVNQLSERWKLSNARQKRMKLLTGTSLKPQNEAYCKKEIRAFGKDDYTDLLLLHMAEGGPKEPALAAIHLARSWQVPQFPVTGDDLKALGFSQGKTIGEALKTLEEKWEEGGYTASKEQLLKSVQRSDA